jgi:hypothetical protein
MLFSRPPNSLTATGIRLKEVRLKGVSGELQEPASSPPFTIHDSRLTIHRFYAVQVFSNSRLTIHYSPPFCFFPLQVAVSVATSIAASRYRFAGQNHPTV